jgi:hypothetical protein
LKKAISSSGFCGDPHFREPPNPSKSSIHLVYIMWWN